MPLEEPAANCFNKTPSQKLLITYLTNNDTAAALPTCPKQTKTSDCVALGKYHLALLYYTTSHSSKPYVCLSPARTPTKGDDESSDT